MVLLATPLMVLLATPLMDHSSTHLAESFRIFVFRFLALAKEVPYVFLSEADSKAPAKVSRRLPIALISELPRRLILGNPALSCVAHRPRSTHIATQDRTTAEFPTPSILGNSR